MALAALAHAEEVVLMLAARMPHKEISQDELCRRLEWMKLLAGSDERISVATAAGGLYVEMVREARQVADIAEVGIVCGRDAAERAIGWDYGEGPGFTDQLKEFTLLVAPRMGRIKVEGPIASRIVELDLDENLQLLSSTEARGRFDAGERWEDIIPARIAAKISGF